MIDTTFDTSSLPPLDDPQAPRKIFLAGMVDDPDLLVFSTPVDVENFPASNYFRVGNSEGQGGMVIIEGLERVPAEPPALYPHDPDNGMK